MSNKNPVVVAGSGNESMRALAIPIGYEPKTAQRPLCASPCRVSASATMGVLEGFDFLRRSCPPQRSIVIDCVSAIVDVHFLHPGHHHPSPPLMTSTPLPLLSHPTTSPSRPLFTPSNRIRPALHTLLLFFCSPRTLFVSSSHPPAFRIQTTLATFSDVPSFVPSYFIRSSLA